jgi:ketosteroid isomerase-like protein
MGIGQTTLAGSRTEQAMSAQQNKALVTRLFDEVWNDNDMSAAKEVIHPDYHSTENITFASVRGLEVLTADMNFYREMYRDLRFTIDRMFTEGNTVVTSWRATGVAVHEFFTSRAGKEVNRELQAEGVSLSQIADGKIIESRLYWPRHPLFP